MWQLKLRIIKFTIEKIKFNVQIPCNVCVWAQVGLRCNKRKLTHMEKKNSACGLKWVQPTKNHQQKKVWA